jgi:outer membrane protein assembly factor BamB
MDNHLYAVKSDGTLAWRFDTRDWVISSPAIGSNGTIYFGSYNQNIYAMSPDGKVLWKYKTDKYITGSPTLISGGMLYIGSDDNYLYALQTDSPGPAETSWPKLRGDIQNSGRVDKNH